MNHVTHIRGSSLEAAMQWAATVAAVRCKGRRPRITAVRRPGNPAAWHVTVS